MKGFRAGPAILLVLLAQQVLVARPALASTPGGVDSGDTAFMLAAAALVMLMTPGR